MLSLNFLQCSYSIIGHVRPSSIVLIVLNNFSLKKTLFFVHILSMLFSTLQRKTEKKLNEKQFFLGTMSLVKFDSSTPLPPYSLTQQKFYSLFRNKIKLLRLFFFHFSIFYITFFFYIRIVLSIQEAQKLCNRYQNVCTYILKIWLSAFLLNSFHDEFVIFDMMIPMI